jgi:lysophospholipase L1-like esterase
VALVVAACLGRTGANAAQPVAPSHPLIEIGGLFFAGASADIVSLDRFSAAVLADPGGTFTPANAKTTACATIRVRTDSPTVRFQFQLMPGLDQGHDFSVYQNGAFHLRIVSLDFTVGSVNPGVPVTFEVVCPSLAVVAFAGIQIADGATLLPVTPRNLPRYAAFGDSITHGTGQGSWSDLSYPWLLARRKNWQVFNLAVTGSRATPSFGAMIDDQPIDVATMLWGHNDWNWENDLPAYRSRCEQFVANFRLHHPTTALYLITLIASTRTSPGINNGYTREDYRNAIRQIVAARVAAGDAGIVVLEGESMTSLNDLSDGTHLSTEGAENFANALALAIQFQSRMSQRCDFDRDGDVDQADFGHLQSCLSGTGVAQDDYDCRNGRLDDDNDVDEVDLTAFLGCMGGADRTPTCP